MMYGTDTRTLSSTRAAFFPKGPMAEDYHLMDRGTPMYAVSTFARKPEDTALVMADLAAIWDDTRPQYITDDTIILDRMQLYLHSERDKEIVLEGKNIIVPDKIRYFGKAPEQTINASFTKILTQYISPYSEVESIRTVLQAAIDSMEKAR
jgi:hypothetical protein